MNTIQLQPLTNQVRDGAKDAASAARDVVDSATAAGQSAANAASAATRDIYQSARAKAGDLYEAARVKAGETYQEVRTQADHTADVTSTYVRKNPLPVLLGAVTFGLSVGCLLALALRRPEPSFRRHYVDEPLDSARDAVFAVLAPVVKRLQSTCEATRDGAGRALEGVHQFHGAQAVDGLAGQLHRVGDRLKFW